jgi:hypothetical protein
MVGELNAIYIDLNFIVSTHQIVALVNPFRFIFVLVFFSYALVLEYLRCSSNIYFGECGCTGVMGWLRVKSICCNNFRIVFIFNKISYALIFSLQKTPFIIYNWKFNPIFFMKNVNTSTFSLIIIIIRMNM